METKAQQKFILMSPRKIRLVADMVRKLTPLEALKVLPFSNKKAAIPLAKVIKTAVANAKDKGASDTDLFFKEIQITEGPRLKRGRPVSRGQWHPVKKRMSHIRVVVAVREKSKPEGDKKQNEKALKAKGTKKPEIKEPVKKSKGAKRGTKN